MRLLSAALLALLAIAFASTLARFLTSDPIPDPRPPEEVEINGLFVKTKDLALGDVWEQPKFVWEFPVENRTTQDIQVTGFSLSCQCLETNPKSLLIPAGQTSSVRVVIDLTHRRYSEIGHNTRRGLYEVQPRIAGKPTPRVAWTLQGTVHSLVTLDTLHLGFGQSPVHGQTSASRTVCANVHVPYDRLEVTVEPNVATVTVDPVRPNAKDVRIMVTRRSTLPMGTFTGQLRIRLTKPDGSSVAEATLQLSGDVQPEVRPFPAKLMLAGRAMGDTASGLIVLQTPSESAWIVDQTEIDSADLKVEPARVEGIPDGRAFRILARLTKKEQQRTEVRFGLRKPGGISRLVSVEVYYSANEPVANVEAQEAKRP